MFMLAYKVQSWARSNQQKPGAWLRWLQPYRMTLNPIRPGLVGSRESSVIDKRSFPDGLGPGGTYTFLFCSILVDTSRPLSTPINLILSPTISPFSSTCLDCRCRGQTLIPLTGFNQIFYRLSENSVQLPTTWPTPLITCPLDALELNGSQA